MTDTDDDSVPPERPQAWHVHRMSHSLNVAWLGEDVGVEHMNALEDAWDRLVVQEDWRAWVRDHLVPGDAYLYLAVDDVPRRRLRETPTGASLELPTAELVRAEEDGTLVELLTVAIRDLYQRWADGHGHPGPPDLPGST